MESITPKALADSLKTLHSKADKACLRLISLYEKLPIEDPRRATARNIKSIISSALVMAIHYDENLQDTGWWQQRSAEEMTLLSIKKEQEIIYCLIGWSSLFFAFSVFEAGIRRVIRILDPSACSNGNDNFESITKWLFKRLNSAGWTFSFGDPEKFLDLYRNTRNTIHNNGIFYPKNGKNISCVWRGTNYEFECGKNREVGLQHCFLLIEYLIELNLAIIVKNKIH